jgi:uncharacterized protein (TIGR03067 family)
MKMVWFGFVAAGLLLGADAKKDDGKKATEKLQGTWKAVSVEEKGQSKEDDKDHRVIFRGDELTIKRGDEEIIKGKFKIDAAQKPNTIDCELTQSPKKEHKGKTALGIYSLEGDTLKWCLNEPGGTERPKDFAGAAGTNFILVTLKREKP